MKNVYLIVMFDKPTHKCLGSLYEAFSSAEIARHAADRYSELNPKQKFAVVKVDLIDDKSLIH